MDLAPTSRYGRTWSAHSIFTMRGNDLHSLGNYGFAIGLFALGLGAWQVLTVLGVGALLVLASLALLILPRNLYTSPVVLVYFLGGLGAAARVALRDHQGGLPADPPLQRERAPALHGHPRRRVRLPRRRDPREIGAFIPAALVSLVLALLPVFRPPASSRGSSGPAWAPWATWSPPSASSSAPTSTVRPQWPPLRTTLRLARDRAQRRRRGLPPTCPAGWSTASSCHPIPDHPKDPPGAS